MTSAAEREHHDESIAVLWDFDRTLATRVGGWAACLVEVLDDLEPGHGVTAEALRPFLQRGFPWHTPETAHPELSDPELWWRRIFELLASAYQAVGFSESRARALAQQFRDRYLDCRLGWQTYEDTQPALAAARKHGWRNIVFSNHVPELPAIISALGIGEHVDAVVSSATSGFEKPHPEAFRLAQAAALPATNVWMVGDDYRADVAGAEAVGLKAILVRRSGDPRGTEPTEFKVDSLVQAVSLIDANR